MFTDCRLPYELRSFSPGAVATIALWNSAPVDTANKFHISPLILLSEHFGGISIIKAQYIIIKHSKNTP